MLALGAAVGGAEREKLRLDTALRLAAARAAARPAPPPGAAPEAEEAADESDARAASHAAGVAARTEEAALADVSAALAGARAALAAAEAAAAGREASGGVASSPHSSGDDSKALTLHGGAFPLVPHPSAASPPRCGGAIVAPNGGAEAAEAAEAAARKHAALLASLFSARVSATVGPEGTKPAACGDAWVEFAMGRALSVSRDDGTAGVQQPARVAAVGAAPAAAIATRWGGPEPVHELAACLGA